MSNPMTYAQDKKRVGKMFKSGKIIYFGDISEKFGIDLKRVVKICKELIGDGVIYVADDAPERRKKNGTIRSKSKNRRKKSR